MPRDKFLTANEAGGLAFSYFLRERFRGNVFDAAGPAGNARARVVSFEHGQPTADKPVDLRFNFPRVRNLEIVHQRPVHLMVVSAALTNFGPNHPEWQPGNWYSVTHTFPEPEKYRLFAQFTGPGEAERVETSTLMFLRADAWPEPLPTQSA